MNRTEVSLGISNAVDTIGDTTTITLAEARGIKPHVENIHGKVQALLNDIGTIKSNTNAVVGETNGLKGTVDTLDSRTGDMEYWIREIQQRSAETFGLVDSLAAYTEFVLGKNVGDTLTSVTGMASAMEGVFVQVTDIAATGIPDVQSTVDSIDQAVNDLTLAIANVTDVQDILVDTASIEATANTIEILS